MWRMHDMEKLLPIMSTRNGFVSRTVSHPANATAAANTAAPTNFTVFIKAPFRL
jgi:hypothetical protein